MVLGPQFHVKPFSSSIRSCLGQHPRSSAVFSLICEWSLAGDLESYRYLCGWASLKVYKTVSHSEEDLDSLHCWSNDWHRKFNTYKCEVLIVSCKCHPFRYNYKLNNSLKRVTEVQCKRPWQGSKLRLMRSPMRLTFSPWRLKIWFSRHFGDQISLWFRFKLKE